MPDITISHESLNQTTTGKARLGGDYNYSHDDATDNERIFTSSRVLCSCIVAVKITDTRAIHENAKVTNDPTGNAHYASEVEAAKVYLRTVIRHPTP